jgi:hypothetical protein
VRRQSRIAILGVMAAAAVALVATVPPAGASGIVIKATPSKGLKNGETVKVTGQGLPYATAGAPNQFFMAECTSAVVAVLSTSDTGHCNIGAVESLHVSPAGSFTAKIKMVTGIVGDGKCGVKGHLTCVIGVGDLTQQGTVIKITFKKPH